MLMCNINTYKNDFTSCQDMAKRDKYIIDSKRVNSSPDKNPAVTLHHHDHHHGVNYQITVKYVKVHYEFFLSKSTEVQKVQQSCVLLDNFEIKYILKSVKQLAKNYNRIGCISRIKYSHKVLEHPYRSGGNTVWVSSLLFCTCMPSN